MPTVRIALASLRQPRSIDEGVERMLAVLRECRRRKARIVCTSETYLPGLRSWPDTLPPPDQRRMERALSQLRAGCRENKVAASVGMEWVSRLGLENRAVVISGAWRVLGYQTKNQITPGSESRHYVHDGKRCVFRINGLVFGIAICHEGWRYPETVRWAAVRGAQVVFQPQVTRRPKTQRPPARWGDCFYEQAMACRAQENSIYFASVNQALRDQASRTSLVSPSGQVLASLPLGRGGLLIADLDTDQATLRYAQRYRPERYPTKLS